jgi:hypothetical protein
MVKDGYAQNAEGEIKELPFEPFRDEEGNLKSLYITKSAFLKNKNYLR